MDIDKAWAWCRALFGGDGLSMVDSCMTDLTKKVTKEKIQTCVDSFVSWHFAAMELFKSFGVKLPCLHPMIMGQCVLSVRNILHQPGAAVTGSPVQTWRLTGSLSHQWAGCKC